MSYGFDKLIILPSNGLEYDKYVYLSPVTYEYFLFGADTENESLTQTESLISILRKYLKIPFPIHELYTHDLYYLWINFLGQILEDKYYLNGNCKRCNHKNKLAVNFADISVNYYENSDVYKIFTIPNKDIEIKYRRRKVKDNLDFSLSNNSEELDFDQMINYLIPQIVEIRYKNNTIPIKEAKELLKFQTNFKDLSELFIENFIKNDFGINNDIEYKCSSCSEINATQLFNDYGASMIVIERNEEVLDKVDLFKTVLSISKTPAATIDEILKMPYRNIKDLLESLSKIEFQALF